MPAPNYQAFIAQLLAGSLKPMRLHDATAVVEEWPAHVIAVGGIYETTSGVDPGLSQAAGGLGYGSWQRFGNGRVLVGLDENDSAINTPAATTGAATATPSGTVSAPTFTGSAVASQAVSAGTPAGTNSAPTLSGSTASITAGTPAGTISALTTGADSSTTGGVAKAIAQTPTFTGTALAAHAHGVGTLAASAPTFTGSALATHAHNVTAAGANSVPMFTGAALSVVQPSIVVYRWRRVG